MSDNSELMPWHKNWLTNIEYNRVDLVKEGANSKAHIKLTKFKGGSPMEFAALVKTLKPEHQEVVEKHLAKLEADAQAALAAAVEKAKQDAKKQNASDGDAEDQIDGGSDESIEKILKSVQDPAVRKLLETQIAKTKAAETAAKDLIAKQLHVEASEIAKSIPNIGAEDEKIVELYKKLKSFDDTVCGDVFGILKSASALIKESGAFSEVGKSSGNHDYAGGVGSDVASAWGKIEAAAEGIAKSRNITQSAAISEVIKSHPELYDAYIKAQESN